MTDSEQQPEEIIETTEVVEAMDVYVRGSALPGYKGYCPITETFVYRQPDGSYLDGSYNAKLSESDFLEPPGFLVVHLGSIERDYTVETAANALFNSLKSLFAACDIPVDFERIRTTVELSEFMKMYRANYSHLILIGHGSTDGISFLDKPSPIGGSELAGCLGSDQCSKPLQIISLCCHSGCKNLSAALSNADNVTDVIAPNDEFDMRWAVHFVTGFLLYQFIENMTVDDALKNAAKNSGSAPMCVWRNAELTGTCAT